MQTLVAPKLETITLYYRAGTSDKVYHCAIEPAGERFVVNYAYGRRGSTLNTGTKTNVPVEYDNAKRVFDQLVKAKLGKCYSPGETGTPYQTPESENTFTGILPQLLNPIEDEEALRLLHDTHYCAQEKFDGRHLLVRKQDAAIHGINKKGLLIGLPETVFQDVYNLPGNCLPDGEAVGDHYHAFDLLMVNGEDLRPYPYGERLTALMNLQAGSQHRFLQYTETAFTTPQKLALWRRLQTENREGIVFKRLDAPYTPGRPNSGGPQLKYKFYASAACVVAKINAQRSVEVRLLGDDGWMPCGNVTIPPNHQIPAVGQVIETRYLYAIRTSNALYQPVYQGLRSDVDVAECLLTQLKYQP